jgi:hypothetical protein
LPSPVAKAMALSSACLNHNCQTLNFFSLQQINITLRHSVCGREAHGIAGPDYIEVSVGSRGKRNRRIR